jgi:hypothetical protein
MNFILSNSLAGCFFLLNNSLTRSQFVVIVSYFYIVVKMKSEDLTKTKL